VQTGTSTRSSPVRPPPSKLPGGSSSRFLEDLKARVGGGAGVGSGPGGGPGVGGRLGGTNGIGGSGHPVNGESVSEDSNTVDTSDFEPSRASGITDTPPSSIGGGIGGSIGGSIGGADSNGRPNFGGMADSLTARIAQMQAARGKPIDLSSPPIQATPLPPANGSTEVNGDIPIPPPPPLPNFRSAPNTGSNTENPNFIPAPPPMPPMMGVKSGTATPDSSFTPPPPPPPMTFSPMSKAGSLPGSNRSSVQAAPTPFQMVFGGRKDVPLTANTRMKQLQWDKISQQAVGKTIWKDEEVTKEQEWVQKLLNDGVWKEMEEDFKAKQLVINLMGNYTFSRRTSFLTLLFSQAQESRTEKCPGSPDKAASR
jgi:hypothetical protein